MIRRLKTCGPKSDAGPGSRRGLPDPVGFGHGLATRAERRRGPERLGRAQAPPGAPDGATRRKNEKNAGRFG